MKDNKLIKKILFTSKDKVALVVFNTIGSEKNIIYAKQVNVDDAKLEVKITHLLTTAANFLGFNIKDVDLVFDDNEITKYDYSSDTFDDCYNEDDIAREIYKKAKIDNYFVNEINFYGVTYDEIEKVAKANCSICASNYLNYKRYVNAAKACNLKVNSSTNIYKLLASNKTDIELTIRIDNDKICACEYCGNKLENVKNIEIDFNELKKTLCKKFDINFAKSNALLTIANNLCDSTNTINITNNYDLRNKKYKPVNVNDLINEYHSLIKAKINNYITCNKYQYVNVVSNSPINNIYGSNFNSMSDLYSELDAEKLICINNIKIDKKHENTQFNFENKIENYDLMS